MRRRLFWVTYKLDRLLSQSLGRPPAIPDGFINVPMPSHLHDVDIHPDHYGPLEGEACSYKAVFIHTTKLRQLQSEILNNTYGTMNTSPPAEEWFDEMFERLKEWLATSPDPRGAVSTEGYAISFHSRSCPFYFLFSTRARKLMGLQTRHSYYTGPVQVVLAPGGKPWPRSSPARAIISGSTGACSSAIVSAGSG
jgi:hypothetical protein